METPNPHEIQARADKVAQLCIALIRLDPHVTGSALRAQPPAFWDRLAEAARCNPPSSKTVAAVIHMIEVAS